MVNSQIRIFVSFDDAHDTDLHDLLHAQSTRRSSAFEFSACSQSGTITDAWTASSRTRIRAADEVVVICGVHTNAAPRVAAELRIAHEEGKPCLLLWGRRELMCTKPDGARSTDTMFIWTAEMLESQLNATLRNSKFREASEARRRT